MMGKHAPRKPAYALARRHYSPKNAAGRGPRGHYGLDGKFYYTSEAATGESRTFRYRWEALAWREGWTPGVGPR